MIELEGDLYVLGDHRLEALNIRFHLFYNSHSGGIRALRHGDVDSSAPVEERVSGQDVGAIFNESHVAQEDGRPSAGTDGKLVQIVNVCDYRVDG